ncbi:MAG: hypothetical protein ACKVOO_03540 [Burkholderiaceae bacterium]
MRWPVAPCLGGAHLSAWALLAGLTATAAAQPTPSAPAAASAAQGADQRAAETGIDLRRAQTEPLTYPLPPIDPNQVLPPQRFDARISLPVPDRWRIVERLGVKDNIRDPYNQNTLKGDRPFEPFGSLGPDWFLNVSAVSDSLLELRNLPTPVGAQSSARAGANDVFGQGRQSVLVQSVILSASVLKGNTTFKPPDYEYKFTGVFNINHARIQEVRGLNLNPQTGTRRTDEHFGLQEAFVDVHLRNVSDNYDFDSIRVGIQPLISDFRGFLFQDQAFAVRLFGTRESNRQQYNLAWFRRLEKDTNSGLNDVVKRWRDDDTFFANVYQQDWPVLGHTTQFSAIHNVNREGSGSDFYDRNGALVRPAVIGDVRPHNYRVTYLGVNGDGHFGRWNLTSSAYLALGRASYDAIAQQKQRIQAGFAAAELSRDFDWIRVRATGILTTGDRNPFDDKSTGFDAILENPQIAGADTSFWIRQAIPLIGGGGVALSGRNGVLPSLRSSKDQGQSNFVNPGLRLFGIGTDLDLSPQVRLLGNISSISFADTSVLQYLRNQANVPRHLGTDLSLAVQYRPFSTQNFVVNMSLAWLQPGQAYKQLFDTDKRPYSLLLNALLTY